MTRSQDADQFVHVVLIRGQDGDPAQLLGYPIGGTRIQAFSRNQNHKYVALLTKGVHRVRYRRQVMLVRPIRRQALVRPDGILGSMFAGFYQLVPPPFPVGVFADPGEALEWLGRATRFGPFTFRIPVGEMEAWASRDR